MSGEQTSVTFRVDADLQVAFVAACRGNDRSASQVLRDAMRGYVSSNAQPGLPFEAKAKPRAKAKAKGTGNAS